MEKTFNYYYDEEKNIIYITRYLLEKARSLNLTIEGNPKIINNSNCYSINYKDLKKLEELTKTEGIENKITTKKKPTNIIIAYNLNNVLYNEENISNSNNATLIMGRPCFKTTIEDLNKCNKKYVIVKVYSSRNKINNITICNYNNILFIPEDFLNTNNINIENNRRIKVNNEIYKEISSNELNIFKNNFNIKFIIRNIIPANK